MHRFSESLFPDSTIEVCHGNVDPIQHNSQNFITVDVRYQTLCLKGASSLLVFTTGQIKYGRLNAVLGGVMALLICRRLLCTPMTSKWLCVTKDGQVVAIGTLGQ